MLINVIELDQVSKSFGSHQALRSVSFAISQPEALAVLGPSGSGKSTLARLLNGILSPDLGTVFVQGEDLSKLPKKRLRKLRQTISFLPQGYGLVSRLSALENVMIGSLSTLRMPRLGIRSYPRHIQNKALDALRSLGIESLARRRVDSLSGGEKQRVAIARCLIQDPIMIIADEPATSLDPRTAEQAIELLVGLSDELRIPILLTLHQPDLAIKYVKRIIGIRGGETVFDCPAQSLNQKTIEELYAIES